MVGLSRRSYKMAMQRSDMNTREMAMLVVT